MEHSTSTPNERVSRITQLAKLSFNHPSVVLTADVFQLFNKKPTEAPTIHTAPDTALSRKVMAVSVGT